MKKLYKFLLNKLPRPLLIRLSYPFKKLAPLLYKGNNVECPVCGKSYSKFLSYGANNRDNVLCPGDLTLERHRLMWLYLRDFSDFFTADRLKVLHIAPEQCFHKKFQQQKNRLLCRPLSWLREPDLNRRPSGYEPDELPGCSIPRPSLRGAS